jgi:hypothetical protein
LRVLDFESSASASSATPACERLRSYEIIPRLQVAADLISNGRFNIQTAPASLCVSYIPYN